jgi:hypothetical protein
VLAKAASKIGGRLIGERKRPKTSPLIVGP